MSVVRIIPRLDIKGPNLVKGIHLEGLRVLGRPEKFAKYYYEQGADELMFVDAVASLYERNSLEEIVSKTARELFIPLTVGGGIRTLDDIKRILRAGADKVSINTAAIKNPEFISRAAEKFGSSTIVLTIEAIKQENGTYMAYTDNGREYTGVEVVEWASKAEALGAGEIVITSVDCEGTGLGFDAELTTLVANAVSVPVIAHGGAGEINHFQEILSDENISAVAVASMLHYGAIDQFSLNADELEEGNIDFLSSGKKFSKINTTTINEIKNSLHTSGLKVRGQV